MPSMQDQSSTVPLHLPSFDTRTGANDKQLQKPKPTTASPSPNSQNPTPSSSSKTDSRPPSYRLSRELDELLRWEGLNRSRNSREDYSFRHEDIVEILEYADDDDEDAKQSEFVDEDFNDSISYSAMSDILASAKKKLDLLEGNLKGARHSLLLAPALPSPVSSDSLRSTTSDNSKASLSTCSEGYGEPHADAISAPAPLVNYSTSPRADTSHGRFFGKSSCTLNHDSTSGRHENNLRSNLNTQQRPRNPLHEDHSPDGTSDDEIPPTWSLSRHNRNMSSTESSSQPTEKMRNYENSTNRLSQKGKSHAPRPSDDVFRSQTAIQLSGRPSSELNVPGPLTPHENRADAFDYENYLLRTGLTDLNPRRPSSSSAHSSATARAAPREAGMAASSSHLTGPSPLNNNYRQSYSTTGTSTTTDTDSLTTDDWDSESDVSDDQDLDELLHEDLDCKWPMPPAFHKKPMPSGPSETSQPPPIPTTVLAKPTKHAAPPSPPQTSPTLMTRPRPKKPQTSTSTQHASKPSTSTQSTTASSKSASSIGAKSLNAADQALVFALSEAMRDACLKLRDGTAQEQVLWRMRVRAATRVLADEG